MADICNIVKRIQDSLNFRFVKILKRNNATEVHTTMSTMGDPLIQASSTEAQRRLAKYHNNEDMRSRPVKCCSIFWKYVELVSTEKKYEMTNTIHLPKSLTARYFTHYCILSLLNFNQLGKKKV